MNRMYYSMAQNNDVATINIYGDITSFPWLENDVSADTLSKQLEQLNGVSEINVYINSYGGEVAEGLAIYNALRRHNAKIKTYCDGFACSIASVIFMAGDERIMHESSLLMIHNAWTWAEGNADELRNQADDLEKITQASVIAYKAHSNLTEEEIKALMDNETWILPQEAIEYGFATAIATSEQAHASQSVKKSLMQIILAHQEAKEAEDETEEEPEDNPPEEEPTTEDDTSEDETEEDAEDGEEETEEETTEEIEEEKEVEVAQKWGGFFNALLK